MKPDTGLGKHDLWLVRRDKDFKDFWLVCAGADAREALERILTAGICAGRTRSTASARPNERWGNRGSGTCTIRTDALHIHAA